MSEMLSTSLLSERPTSPLHADKVSGVDKAEMSKQLFAQIDWQEILRAGVLLSDKDVR